MSSEQKWSCHKRRRRSLKRKQKHFGLPFLQILFLVSFEKSFLPITHDFVTFVKPEAKRHLFLRAFGQAALHRGCVCTAHPATPGFESRPSRKKIISYFWALRHKQFSVLLRKVSGTLIEPKKEKSLKLWLHSSLDCHWFFLVSPRASFIIPYRLLRYFTTSCWNQVALGLKLPWAHKWIKIVWQERDYWSLEFYYYGWMMCHLEIK